jgi:hypothetical protein
VALVVPFGSVDRVAEQEKHWLDLHPNATTNWFWLLPLQVKRFTAGATARQDRLDLLRMGNTAGWTLGCEGVAVLPSLVQFPPKASGKTGAVGCGRL